MARPDLRALTDDGLVQLANAGLVKRALREVAAGQGPALAEAEDGTVEARFADGTVTRLGPGRPPGEASCTCPASGMCRHRVALVVAYRAAAVADGPAQPAAPAAVAWDPGSLDGAAFEAGLGGAAAAELRRLLAGGITVGLERGAVPAARLPTATVRFLVPDAVGYARCDCAAGGGCAHVALAIRAFRAAGGAAEIRLGGAAPAGAEAGPAEEGLAEAADRVVAGLLEAGVVSGPEAHDAALVRLRRAAERRGATQILLAEADLAGQLAAYAGRHAAYDAAVVLALATELLGRVRGGESALGVGQPYETAMGRTRLVSLGARLLARGRGASARVALADTDTGALLALERDFAPGEAEVDFVGSLPGRLLGSGLSVSGTGQGQILTSVARRRADGLLALGRGAQGRTALLPRDARVTVPAPGGAGRPVDPAPSGRAAAGLPAAARPAGGLPRLPRRRGPGTGLGTGRPDVAGRRRTAGGGRHAASRPRLRPRRAARPGRPRGRLLGALGTGATGRRPGADRRRGPGLRSLVGVGRPARRARPRRPGRRRPPDPAGTGPGAGHAPRRGGGTPGERPPCRAAGLRGERPRRRGRPRGAPRGGGASRHRRAALGLPRRRHGPPGAEPDPFARAALWVAAMRDDPGPAAG